MTRITDDIWIGDSDDEWRPGPWKAVLNVAIDLHATRGCKNWVEYAQIGLIDGPGNELSAYCAAVLTLHFLLQRGNVLVCCHSGGRALAVVIMYLITKKGKTSTHPTFLNCWMTWDKMHSELCARLGELPESHVSHKEAADKLPMALFEFLL